MPYHENEDLPHYHLFVRSVPGSMISIPELFRDDNAERGIDADTIGDIKTYLEDLMGWDNPEKIVFRGKVLFWNQTPCYCAMFVFMGRRLLYMCQILETRF
jgi:hypothetical protein